MDKIREQLEGTTRLFRVRRIKRVVLIVLSVLILLLSVAVLASEGAGLAPFYLPLDSVLPLFLIMLLVASITNFVFRTLEIRHVKRDSQRFLIAKRSVQRALIVIVVCSIVGVSLILPFTQQVAQVRTTRMGTVPPGPGISLNFSSRDVFALSKIVDAEVTATQGSLRVLVTWVEDGNAHGLPNGFAYPSDSYSFTVRGEKRVDYQVVIRNSNPRPVDYQLILRGTLVTELTTAVPAVLFALAVANALWILYLRPVRAKLQVASIYGARYPAEVGAGEQTYMDYRRGAPTSAGSGAARPMPRGAAPTMERRPPPAPTIERPPPAPAAKAEPPAVRTKGAAELITEGSKLFASSDLENALERFDTALELEPENVTALLAASAILMRLERRDEASGSFHRVLEIDPKNVQALEGVAKVLEADGEWGEAADAWDRYATVVTFDADARLKQAEALVKAKDRGAAIRVLEEARVTFPQDGRIRVRLEEIHVDVPSLLSKALVASSSGRLEQAIALLDRILAQEPDNVNALVSRGIALRRADRRPEALATLEAALQRQPTNTAALRAKAQVLEEQGALEDALRVYDSLHEASPHDAEVFALQASVFEKLGNTQEALASYQQASSLDGANAEYRAKAEALVGSRGTQEQFMEELFTIKGMGPARVRALLDAGYRSPESIRGVTEEELAKVSGLTKSVARDVHRHFREGPRSA